VAVAAAWGLARLHDAPSLPVLRRIAREGTPSMRALAVLGVGMAHDKGSVPEVAGIAGSVDAGNVARAAAAYALGDLDGQAQVPMLLALAEESDPLPRRMALVALARMATSSPREPAWQREAVQAMADAVFAGADDGTRGQASADAVKHAAVASLAALATGGDKAGRATAAEVLPVPDGALDVDDLLDALVPREVTSADRRAALVRFAGPLQRSALAALRTSSERARAVLDALGSGEGELAPFVARGETGPAADQARAVVAALEPSLIPLARHPDPAVRTKAIVLVARSSSDAAVEAVVAGLEDPDEAVQRVALAAVGAPRADGGRTPASGGSSSSSGSSTRSVGAVGKILTANESWAMRVLAARALGRLGAAGAGPDAARLLGEAAIKDTYALVRQAALEALSAFDTPGARALATRMAAADPEPRVREGAQAIAAGQTPHGE
jgi:HEAT repeat protein